MSQEHRIIQIVVGVVVVFGVVVVVVVTGDDDNAVAVGDEVAPGRVTVN